MPRKVAALCCQHQLSSSGAPWGQPWLLLNVLMAKTEPFLRPNSNTVGSTSASEPLLLRGLQGDNSTLRRCIVQQLQQAGIFEHCATVMLAAARLLQAEADTIATVHSAAAATSAQGMQDRTGSTSMGSSSSGGNSSGATCSSSATGEALSSLNICSDDRARLLRTCGNLLEVACALLPLQEADSAGCSSIVAATSVLLVSAVRFLDVACAKVGPTALGDRQLLEKLPQIVARTFVDVMRGVTQCSNSMQVLQSKDVQSAVDLAALLVHTRSLLPAQHPPPAGSSRGTSSGNSEGDPSRTNSTSGSANAPGAAELVERLGQAMLGPASYAKLHAIAQRAKGAWEAAQQLELGQQCGLHEPLLLCLGIRLRTVGWLAGYVSDLRVTGAIHLAEETARAVATISRVRWALQQLGGQAGLTPAQLAVMQQGPISQSLQQLSHTLLAVQLLVLAAQQGREQQQQRGAAWVGPCWSAAAAAMSVAKHVHEDWDVQFKQWAQSSPQLAKWARRELRRVLDPWAGKALPIVLQLMAGLQQEAHSVTAAAAATSTGPGSSSSSRASRTSSSRIATSSTHSANVPAPAPPAPADVMSALLTCILLLCNLGCWECSYLESPPTGAASSSIGGANVSVCWLEHGAAISTALEGVWRVYGRLGVLSCTHVTPSWYYLKNLLGPSERGPLLLGAVLAGPGSQQQLQLFSMLCSLFMLCNTLRGVDAENVDMCVGFIHNAASTMCNRNAQQQHLAAGHQPSAAAPQPAASDVSTAVTAASQEPAATGRIPWLVLLGRCWLFDTTALQQLQQSRPNLGQLLLRARAQVGGAEPHLFSVFPAVFGVHTVHKAASVYAVSGWCDILDGCNEWVTQGEGVEELATAGYPMHEVGQHAKAAVAAVRALAAAEGPAATAAAYADFAQQLQGLGSALNTLPMPHACNNAGCTSMLGASELASVSGRSCICAGCLVARYCGRACQRAAWKQHKPVCKALAASAAGAADRSSEQA